MNDYPTQDELLEQYLNTLVTDPHAKPPPGLEPEIAETAWLLVADAPPSAPVGAADRVWRRALHGAQADEDTPLPSTSLHTIAASHDDSIRENDMNTVPMPERPTRPVPLPLTLAAAVMALVAMAGLFLLNGGGAPPEPQSGAGIVLQNTTPTVLPPTTAPITPASGGGGGGTAPDDINPPDNLLLQATLVPPNPMVQASMEPQSEPSLEFILQQIPPQPIELGEAYSGQLSSELPYATFRYVTDESALLAAVVNAEGFQPDFRFSFRSAPSDSPFGGGGGGGGGGGPLRSPQIIRMGDGTAHFIIGQQLAIPGEASLFTIRFEPIASVPVVLNEPTSGTIGDGTAYAAYSFDAEAGDMLTVRVNGVNGFDTQVQLESEAYSLGRDDDSGPGVNPELYQIPVTTSGPVTAIVSPAFTGDTGAFTLIVERTSPQRLNDGTQSVRLTPKTARTTLVAEGEPGSSASVLVRPLDDAQVLNLQILDGTNLVASTRGENVSQLIRDFVFPENGQVTISIDANDVYGVLIDPLMLEVSLVE